MQLADYFDFLSPDEIKIKGHRIWLEDVLLEYVHNEMTPEQLAQRFPTLTLAEIHACILYYLQHKERIDKYLEDYLEYSQRAWEEQQRNPLPITLRLRALAAERTPQKWAAPAEAVA